MESENKELAENDGNTAEPADKGASPRRWKSMSWRRKALLVLSIAIVALGTLSIALSVIGSIGVINSQPEFAGWIMMFVAVSVVTNTAFVVIGIFGIRGARNPHKLVSSIAVSAAGVVIGALLFFLLIQSGATPDTLISFGIVVVAIPMACLLLAFAIRRSHEGIEDGLLGPDGPEFPNGFNPDKLGFLRVLQVLFAFNVLLSVIMLTTYVKGSYQITFGMLLDMLNLMFDGVVFWMILRRYTAARWFAIGFAIFNIAVGTVFNIAVGDFQVSTQIVMCTCDIAILLYFSTSQRVRAVLVRPFSSPKVEDTLGEGESRFYNLRKWSFWRSVIIYFCTFCVVGHWAEAGYCLFIKFGILPGIYDPASQIWSDWLYPFPVYGFGMVACIILLFPIKNLLQRKIRSTLVALLLSFAINAAVCTGIELVMGLLQNQPVNGVYPLWDYSNMFCNFMGQICLQNALAFGAISTLMVWGVYPLLERFMVKLPNNVANIVLIVVVIFYAILSGLYLVKVTLPTSVVF